MVINEKTFLGSALPIPLIGTLPLSDLAPCDVYHLVHDASPSFLLESGARTGPVAHNRYSFIGSHPYLIVTGTGHRIEHTHIVGSTVKTLTAIGDPLQWVRAHCLGSRMPPLPGLPPFIGGAVGCLAYGLSHRLTRNPPRLPEPDEPELIWLFVDLVIVIDHLEERLSLVFCPPAERFFAESRSHLCTEGTERLRTLAARINTRVRTPPRLPRTTSPLPVPMSADMTRDAYCAMVEQGQTYIASGDIFQANLAQRFTAPLGERDPFDLYRRLRVINPAPFSAYLDLGETQVISSSPERLIRVAGSEVETRPIAGTRPRGAHPDDDQRLTDELLLHPKERAEHIMLVDLERNDLGRVCSYGTVKVDELMVTERYSHVMHIVSNIRGTLRDGATGFDALEAVFPGGTVTGVPKIRCLEIIAELEPTSRGLYTGALGYVSWSGHMDWSIIIRTLVVRRHQISCHVGAGIVAESHPEREYSETLDKAQALFEAVGGV